MSFRKAQFELNETILVVIVISIILIIGLIFFHKFNLASIENIKEQNNLNNFYNLLSTFPDLPEIACSSQNKNIDCIDSLKLLAFQKTSNNYANKFGFKTITIQVIYPELPESNCDIKKFQQLDYPNCNTFLLYDKKPAIFKSTEVISTPISLFYPISNEYKLALLKITRYK